MSTGLITARPSMFDVPDNGSGRRNGLGPRTGHITWRAPVVTGAPRAASRHSDGRRQRGADYFQAGHSFASQTVSRSVPTNMFAAAHRQTAITAQCLLSAPAWVSLTRKKSLAQSQYRPGTAPRVLDPLLTGSCRPILGDSGRRLPRPKLDKRRHYSQPTPSRSRSRWGA